MYPKKGPSSEVASLSFGSTAGTESWHLPRFTEQAFVVCPFNGNSLQDSNLAFALGSAAGFLGAFERVKEVKWPRPEFFNLSIEYLYYRISWQS